jgi:hypothetical protein
MRQTLAAARIIGPMPALKNRRRERFALEIASMTPYARAYAEAGFKDSPWAAYNANKLAHDPAVAARIEELRTEFAGRSQIHAEYIQRQLLPLVEANPQDLFEAAGFTSRDGAIKRDALPPCQCEVRHLSRAI